MFDPAMNDMEARLADLEKRKKNLQGIVKALKECER